MAKHDTIAALQQEVLRMQGFKPVSHSGAQPVLPACINQAFPNQQFPLGAVHELCAKSAEETAASFGFVSAILANLLTTGIAVWISTRHCIFPPALKRFGIDPHRVIFLYPQKQKDVLWTLEECLRFEGLKAVVGYHNELSFTQSRRLQLAVEQSGVTAFIIRQTKSRNTTTSVARWHVTPVSSSNEDQPIGPGFPRWQVTLEKVRNGKPRSWLVEWRGGQLTTTDVPAIPMIAPLRKIV